MRFLVRFIRWSVDIHPNPVAEWACSRFWASLDVLAGWIILPALERLLRRHG